MTAKSDIVYYTQRVNLDLEHDIVRFTEILIYGRGNSLINLKTRFYWESMAMYRVYNVVNYVIHTSDKINNAGTR